jgi:hypothetical protein
MNQNILYVGLDVDGAHYDGSVFNKNRGEVIDLKCRPTLKGMQGKHLSVLLWSHSNSVSNGTSQ